jgi:hypothetical protein
VFAGIREAWGDRRVLMLDQEGHQHSLPLGWTDAAEPDVFVTMSAGRSAFRAADLVELATVVEHLRSGQRGV